MEAMITRWGHSAGIRLPAVLMRTMTLSVGDMVSIRLLDSGDIRLRPVNHTKVVSANPSAKEPKQRCTSDDPW